MEVRLNGLLLSGLLLSNPLLSGTPMYAAPLNDRAHPDPASLEVAKVIDALVQLADRRIAATDDVVTPVLRLFE